MSTGIGQTGWYKSIIAQAKASFEVFGYHCDKEYENIRWEDKKLSYVVREPFPSNTTDVSIVFGTIKEGQPFKVLSKMSEKGVIFSDGMESDAIIVKKAMKALVRPHPGQGNPVISTTGQN